MRTRFPLIVSLLLGVCALAFLFLGNNTLRSRSGFYGATQHGRVISGNYASIYPNRVNPNTSMQHNTGARISGTQPGTGLITKQSTTAQQMRFDSKKAANIRNHLATVDGARHINAVVLGNTVLIGYDSVNSAKKASNTKDVITGKVKGYDGSLKNVIVTDSKEFSASIARLSNNIKNNKPFNELSSEFNKLVQGIKPTGK